MNQPLLINQVSQLKNSLTAIQPQGETAKLITYTLIGVALTAIMVYSYIKSQEYEC